MPVGFRYPPEARSEGGCQVRHYWRYENLRAGSFWRAVTGKEVGAYLDCGLLDNGFARARCGELRAEYLVAFSFLCKGRGLPVMRSQACGGARRVSA
jgi:hypothetical protein